MGFFGTTLDSGRGAGRWKKWRPTVSLVSHDDLVVDRLELLCPRPAEAAVLAEDVQRASPETEVRLHDFDVRDPWSFEEVYGALRDFVGNYTFDLENERYLIHLTTGTHVAQICWFLLSESGYAPAQLIQTSPRSPKDSETRGPSYQIIDLDLTRYASIAQRFEAERRAHAELLSGGIETRNTDFAVLTEQIETVARRSNAPILLTGPTGAGKTQMARRIHALKANENRVRGELVEINCATLRGDQAMSALFGHVKGAFTGAATKRDGLLAQADGGLLFLDEIGELGLDEQAMLLSAIEDKRYLPVGSDVPVQSDFQLIAGTNRELRERVHEGRFREDLLARIDLWHFRLPPLRARSEDIEANVDFELERASRELGRWARFSGTARESYLAFARSAPWPGNFRDLAASVQRLATLAHDGRIDEALVSTETRELQTRWRSEPRGETRLRRYVGDAIEEIDLFDRVQLEAVLEVCARSSSIADAGRRLFDQSRLRRKSTNDADRLRKYLARFGIDASRAVAADR